jgi:UPF0271 protein
VHIDLNADLGEGFGRWTLGDDDSVLGLVTSANIACGFHAGDPVIMRSTCRRAVAQGVAIGAQVGYRDLAGFGRRRMDIGRDDLGADVLYQLGALQAFAAAAGDRVRYLKPHGALYNTAALDADQAGAIVDAVLAFDPGLPVLTLPDSALFRAARAAGLRAVPEAFADRAYTAAGGLVPRSEAGAVLTDPDAIAERALGIARDATVLAVDGSVVQVAAESICVHGDTPGAVAIAQAVRTRLEAAGISLARFG